MEETGPRRKSRGASVCHGLIVDESNLPVDSQVQEDEFEPGPTKIQQPGIKG